MSKQEEVPRKSPSRSAAVHAEELSSFHKAFPAIQPSEKVVESYPCGLKKIRGKSSSVVPVVKMGRLYLTARHCCFQSPFLKVGMCVMWDDVKIVEKKSFFFYDEIHVTTAQEADGEPTQYCLTAFMYGATAGAFDMMHTLWSVCSKFSRIEKGEARQSKAVEASETTPTPVEEETTGVAAPASTPTQAALVVTPRAMPAAPPVAPPSPQQEALVDTEDSDLTATASASEAPRSISPIPSRDSEDTTGLTTPQRRQQKHGRLLARHFGGIPADETVVDEFQCAYVHGVHRVGKLYITSHYLLFYSPFLSESLVLPFADIATIEKVTTLVLLDGIAVSMQRGPVTRAEFSSFVYRDSAFNIIQHFFSMQKGKEALGLVPSAADVSVVNRAERAYTAPSSMGTTLTPLEGEVPAIEMPFKTLTSSPNGTTHGIVATLDELFAAMETDFGTAMSPWSVFATEVLPESTLPAGATLPMCFRILFDDDHEFTMRYHVGRGDTNITIEPWRPLRGAAAGYGGQRTLRCTTVVKAVFTGQYAFIQHQRYAFAIVGGTPHLIVHFSGQVPEVTYGDSFLAESLLIFRNRGNGKVTLTVMGHIQFTKSVWVKGKITSSALGTEMPRGYRRFLTMAEEALSAAIAASSTDRANAESQRKEVSSSNEYRAPSESRESEEKITPPPVTSRRASELAPVLPKLTIRSIFAAFGLLMALLGLYRVWAVPSLESAPYIDSLLRPLLATAYCAIVMWWIGILQQFGLPIP